MNHASSFYTPAQGLPGRHRHAPPGLDPTGTSLLARLKHDPAAAGELIYRGDVYPLRAPDGQALFHYERRVSGAAGGSVTATHLTRDAQGTLVVVEAARYTTGYVLEHFEAAYGDAGHSGFATLVDKRHLHYTLRQGGRSSTTTEEVGHPVVAGPSLHGYIRAHWDVLATGCTLAIRMPVLARQRSYGFTIRRAPAEAGRSAFSITPRSLLVRLALAPLRVEFDNATRNLMRYQGRVPPMRQTNGRYRAFDADVAYTQHAAAYR